MSARRSWWPWWAGGLFFASAASNGAAPPNILLAIADDWSWPHASAYGCRWVRTPAFDQVAERGWLFERAYTPNAKCAPSRAILLTGRATWQLGAAANHVCYFPNDIPVFTEVLAQHGWHVGFTGKGWAPGNSQGRALTGRPYSKRTTTAPTRAISAIDYAANFEDFLAARPASAPFFFWYGGIEPHRPYEFGSGIRLGGKKLEDVDAVPPYWPDDPTVRTDILDYAFEVEYFDQHLGRMLEILDRRGELSNTVVIVTSDNGWPFPRCKGNVYELANHMPLAIQWLARLPQPGRRIREWFTFTDLAPTVLGLAGLAPDQVGMTVLAGVDWSPALRGEAPPPAREFILLGQERHDVGRPHDWGYPVRAILEGSWLYLWNCEPMRWPAGNPETGYMNCDGGPTKSLILNLRRQQPEPVPESWTLCFGRRPAEELYDVVLDPGCATNLLRSEPDIARARALRQRLEAQLRREGDLRVQGRGREYEGHPYANPAHERCYERMAAGEKLARGWIEPTDDERDFYRHAPRIRHFEAVRTNDGVELVWDVSNNPLDAVPTEILIEPHVGYVGEDAGRCTVVASGQREWTLTALNPAGTNRVRAVLRE